MFIIGALLLSTFLAAVAYSFTRSSLLNQRERTSTVQAYKNASVAQREISAGNTNANAIIDRLQQVGVTQAAINIDGTWASPSAKFTSDVIPDSDADQGDQRPHTGEDDHLVRQGSDAGHRDPTRGHQTPRTSSSPTWPTPTRRCATSGSACCSAA